jgi:hypothetical protein
LAYRASSKKWLFLKISSEIEILVYRVSKQYIKRRLFMDRVCQRNIIKVLNASIEMSHNTSLYLDADDSKMPLVSLSAPFLDDEHIISLSDYTGRCENYSLDPTGVITQSIDFNIKCRFK